MVTLPGPANMGARPIPRPQRGLATVTSAGAVAQAAERFGGAVQQGGSDLMRYTFERADREATAAAKERDAYTSDQIRSLLYDPENGFANLQGKNAVAQRDAMLKRLDDLAGTATDGLNNAASEKLSNMLRSRIESAKNTVETHTSNERRTWINGASAARIESAYQDSLFNPEQTEQALIVIESEIRGQAARDGWPQEKLDLALENGRSKVFTDQVKRIASSDPVAAMEFLRKNEDRMSPVDRANMEAALQPVIKEYLGRARGREAFANMAPVATKTLASLESKLGFPLKIISAHRDEDHNRAVGGADDSQHIKGNAFDFDVSHMSTEERIALIRLGRQEGFSGVGIYANSIHFDVGPERAWGPTYSWKSIPDWAQEALKTPTGPRQSPIDDILEIEDPTVRDAALAEYELRSKVAKNKATADAMQLEKTAFDFVLQGNDPDDLPFDVKSSLGREEMSALRSFDGNAETDPAIYLMLKTMQSEEFDRFKSFNLMPYVNSLTPTDLKSFMDAKFAPPTTADEWATSTLMSMAKWRLDSTGITSSDEVAAFQTNIVKWQGQFIRNNKIKPTPEQVQERIDNSLVEVVLDPKGLRNKQKGAAFAIDYEGDPLDPSDDITPDMVLGGTLKINGKVIPRNMIEDFATQYNSIYGQAPEVWELVDGLIASGLF